MDDGERQRLAKNAAGGLRRAQALFDRATAAVAHTSLGPDVRDALKNALWHADGAIASYLMKNFIDGHTVLALAEKSLREAEWLTLAPAAERAQPFIDGPKRPRCDALADLIDQALAQSPNTSTMDLLKIVQTIDGGRVIQEIDDDRAIYWRANGRERRTGFKAFANRTTQRRKKISDRQIPVSD